MRISEHAERPTGYRLLNADHAYAKDPIHLLAVGLFLAIPLVPRPTFSTTIKLLAPGLVIMLVLLALTYSVGRPVRGRSVMMSGAFVAVSLGTVIYGFRVAMLGPSSEGGYALSRILLIVMAVAICYVLPHRGYEVGFRCFAVGFVMLGALVAFIALTGTTFLEEALPARTLGITFPWHKTAGVPRSFGEQGLVLACALAYTLVYWRRLSPIAKLALTSSCVVIVAAGQSRNIYLGTVAVITMWFCVVRPRRYEWAGVALVTCALATLVMEQLIPVLEQSGLGRALIGKGIFEQNIESRFSLVSQAFVTMRDEPLRAFIGISHLDWFNASTATHAVTVHNFFVSSLLFLGVIAGVLTIWGLFVRPLGGIIRRLRAIETLDEPAQKRRQFALTAASGVLVSLNFYEGFFSLTLGVFVGLCWYLMLERDTGPQSEAPHRGAPKGTADAQLATGAGHRGSHLIGQVERP